MQTSSSVKEYLEEHRVEGGEGAAKEGQSSVKNVLAQTWDRTMNAVQKQSQDAHRLTHFLAYLSPDNVPLWFVRLAWTTVWMNGVLQSG